MSGKKNGEDYRNGANSGYVGMVDGDLPVSLKMEVAANEIVARCKEFNARSASELSLSTLFIKKARTGDRSVLVFARDRPEYEIGFHVDDGPGAVCKMTLSRLGQKPGKTRRVLGPKTDPDDIMKALEIRYNRRRGAPLHPKI